tara:strand:+ start:848 stop:1027 length:180 start_codon:yes stop_codon:yes gene_type:complete
MKVKQLSGATKILILILIFNIIMMFLSESLSLKTQGLFGVFTLGTMFSIVASMMESKGY